jgi:hypothetical protein
MAENKKGFVLYADQKIIFEELTDEEAGILIKHVFKYVNDENPILENRIITMAFNPIKLQLKRDLKRWESIRLKRSEAGKKSAESRQQNQQVLTSAESRQQNQQVLTKSTVIVNDNVNVNVNVNDNVNVINIINNWFYDFENGNEILEIARRNNLTIEFIKEKLHEFKKYAELEYPNYGKFVSHFKNWIVKNNPKDNSNPKMVH